MFSSWPAEAGKEISRMAGQSAGQHPFLALVPPHGSMREQINWRQFPAQRARVTRPRPLAALQALGRSSGFLVFFSKFHVDEGHAGAYVID